MSQSITASVVNAPYNGYIFTDINFVNTASIGVNGVTSSVASANFLVPQPWPANALGYAYVYSNITANGAGSINLILQDSPDNATWTPIVNIANPILTVAGTGITGSNVSLQQGGQQYIRVVAQIPVGSYPTGSIGLTYYPAR
jgi:hypothetical protein